MFDDPTRKVHTLHIDGKQWPYHFGTIRSIALEVAESRVQGAKYAVLRQGIEIVKEWNNQ